MAVDESNSFRVDPRIEELERTVAALTTVVSQIYQKMHLDKWKIPWPDELVKNASEYSIGIQSSPPPVKVMPATMAAAKTVEKDLSRMDPYQYSRLSAATPQIRLIGIRSSETIDAPVECDLSIVTLPEPNRRSHELQFMPLSYTWGTLEKTETVVINDRSFRVTANLHKALKHFRNAEPTALCPPGYRTVPTAYLKSKYTKYWWIDAISINQEDMEERESQVRLMTRLYRLATVAHIWLGESNDDSVRAMGLIRTLARRPPEKEQKEFNARKVGQTQILKGPGTLPEPIPSDPPAIPADEQDLNYQALVNLFRRPWFSRVWILQEMALPVNLTIHCGDQVCSWDDMARTASLLVYVADEYQLPNLQRFRSHEADSLLSQFQRVELLSQLRGATQSLTHSPDPYLSLATALTYTKHCGATDLRDKVFATFSFVNPEATQLHADYRSSGTEVYKATALDLAEKHLDFLSACQYSDDSSKDIPSWVPDFSTPWKYYPMIVTLPENPRTEPTKTHSRIYDAEKSILIVRGYIVDTLSTTACASFLGSAASRDDVFAVKQAWVNFIEKYDRDGTLKSAALDDIRYQSSGSATYWPRYESVYTAQNGDHFDLSIRAMSRHLITASPETDLHQKNKVGWYRHFFFGRRFVLTKDRHAGIVPAAAQAGDRVCRLEGSNISYIIREDKPNRWIVIGDACKFFPPGLKNEPNNSI